MPTKHVFTTVAPEANDEELSSKYTEVWKWCIRCGVLKLGREYFEPGPDQKLVLVAATDTLYRVCFPKHRT